MNRKSTVGVINHMYSCSFLLRVICVNRGSMYSQSRKVIIATQGIAPKNMEMPREYYFFQLLNYTSNLRSRPVAYQEWRNLSPKRPHQRSRDLPLPMRRTGKEGNSWNGRNEVFSSMECPALPWHSLFLPQTASANKIIKNPWNIVPWRLWQKYPCIFSKMDVVGQVGWKVSHFDLWPKMDCGLGRARAYFRA